MSGLRPIMRNAGMWDDLKFPATSIRRGASSKPDFDYTNNGLLFPQNDTAEKIHIIGQLPHRWVLESTLSPHLHYVQDESDVPTFKMDYRWYKNGADPTGSFTTISTTTGVFTYTSGSIMQILPFPDIDGTGIDTVSSILDMIIYRDDNTVTGDVLVKEFDIHFQSDDMGSDSEYVKSA